MFLDINNSTKIAEKLGDIDYNNFLNEIFYDLTNSILSTYGEIYRYVGDEVVVTRRMKNGLKHVNCLRTFFQAKYTMRILREKYLTKYGFRPTFSAGYHCGKVIVGEIGDLKSQITFLGHVLYTTASVEKHCRKLEKEILVPKDEEDAIITHPVTASGNIFAVLVTSAVASQVFQVTVEWDE